jgi:hypothetical protein
MRIKDLIKHLEAYDPETACAYALWLPDDVREQAEGHHLADEDVETILGKVQDSHDANIGINWEVIDCAIDWFTEV